VLKLFVRVTVCAALLVATVCAAKVSAVGANVSGRADVPLVSRICWFTVALSVITTAPLIVPLDPSAGEKVTFSVQVAETARTRFATHGTDPVPVAAKSPLVAIAVKVSELLPLFLTVSDLAALVVPTACVLKVRVVGVKVSGAVAPPDPVPERPTSCGENPTESVIVTAPLMLPFALGVNVTAILHLALDASDAPQVVPLEFVA
jgi:hypothetical protein